MYISLEIWENNVKFSKLTPMIYGNYEFDPLDKFS